MRVGVSRDSKVVHIGRLGSLQGDLGCIVVHIEDGDNRFVDPTPDIPPLQQLTFVNDHRNQVISADRRLAYVGMDPSRQVGLNGFVTQHLSDQVQNLPLLRGVLAGDVGEANYSTRVIGPRGRWTSVRAYVRGMVGGGAAFVTSLTFDESSRPVIPVGVLSARETEVVRYLFVGLRIPQIALVLGVSAKRNPMLALMYGFSVSSCLQSAMSEPGGMGLGTLGLHPTKAEELMRAGGFTQFTTHDVGDQSNLYYEIRH
ncbi:hypothetical protein JYT71_00755 [Acidimicrobiaceae bacterium AH-315-P05]|nr:hypothetical protein [Acidimicrobiaceae bacterium AH-315-P05]